MGYAGGTKKNPTYRSLGDHSEAVRIAYDPEVISYDELLAVFWGSHNPCRASVSIQYRSAIFFENPEQEKRAQGSLAEEEGERKKKVLTDIVPIGTFYPAEEYHQKYYLRSHGPLMEELGRLYPDFAGLQATTLAARANGYLGGNLTLEEFADELGKLDLDDADVAKILAAAHRRRR